MFLATFKFELKYWSKQPSVYVFIAVLVFLATVIIAGYAGIFDEVTATRSVSKLANSPLGIHKLFTLFKELILVISAIVFGQAIYRDFDSSIHTVFYSYPFEKAPFFLAKFFSAYILMILITLSIAIGAIIGTSLPGVDEELLGTFSLYPFITEYIVFIWPNLFCYGVIIFLSVALTRNIYSGFISAIVLLALLQILARVFIRLDQLTLFSLVDLFGDTAVKYYTHTWTVVEQNSLSVPITGLVLYNRLLWIGLATVLFVLGYSQFSLEQRAKTFSWIRNKSEKVAKGNFRSVTRINLPLIRFDFSFKTQLQTIWQLSNIDFKYIVKSGPFLVILIVGFISVLFTLSQMNPQYATKLLPVTWLMLLFPVFFFLMVVNLLTFLYAGMLIQRAKSAKMNQLLDVSPVSNWVLIFSKFLALIKMQMVLLALVALAGIIVQTTNGFFDYDLGQYVFHLFVLNLIGCIIWACLAVLIQTIFTNRYLGLFLLIIGAAGLGELHLIGIESPLFKYNQNPDANFLLSYSDMGGYGAGLIPYLTYKGYWLLGGMILLFVSWLLWVRGVDTSLKIRLSYIKSRMTRPAWLIITLLLGSFLGLGFTIKYLEKPAIIASAKGTVNLDRLTSIDQPRITNVKLEIDIYPDQRGFEARGQYALINKTSDEIDSIIVSLKSEVISEYTLNREHDLVYDGGDLDILKLEVPMQPNDSLIFNFTVKNVPNNIFQKNSPIESNGTFLTSHMFAPSIGYRSDRFKLADASDSTALERMYRSQDADFIDFEAVVSTSSNQVAIAPGYLEREWIQGDRKYFKYKSESKVTNDYVINSGVYEVYRDSWLSNNDDEVELSIYHHPTHTYNLERMMNGLKAGLEYNSKNFAPYQHRQARIIEYSRSLGNYGQSYANTLPLSEVSFVADIDPSAPGGLDRLFGGIAHEIAHQWWGHQAIPAGVAGYAMITESMSEYVALKVIEHKYGPEMLHTYVKLSMEKYLKERGRVSAIENSLVNNNGQDESHVPYEKGSLAFYALSDYLGEANLNAIISDYLNEVRFKSAPYTTALEMAEFIIERTPDSLKYLPEDLFNSVILYDNKVKNAVSQRTNSGGYKVTIDLDISKFKSGAGGQRLYSDEVDSSSLSLPLRDYVEVGIFSGGKEIYLKKHLFSEVENKLIISVDANPDQVAVDPYFKLIDTRLSDNYLDIEK